MSKFTQPVLVAALVAAFSLTAAPTLASTTASASLTGFSWTVFDLDLDDGIAAAISFTAPVDYFGNYASAYASNGVNQWVNDYQANTANVSANAALPLFGVAANGAVTTPLGTDPTGLALTASGSVNNLVHNYPGYFSASAGSEYWSFTLSANALVTFRAQVAVSVTTVGDGFQDGNASASLSAWDNFGISETASFATFTETTLGNQYVNATRRAEMYQYEGGTSSFTGVLAVTFSNAAAESVTGYLRGETYAYGQSSITPVPEPHTWAMLFAGLGLLGGVAMRRRGGR